MYDIKDLASKIAVPTPLQDQLTALGRQLDSAASSDKRDTTAYALIGVTPDRQEIVIGLAVRKSATWLLDANASAGLTDGKFNYGAKLHFIRKWRDQ